MVFDNINVNCRITRNLIVGTGSQTGPGPGTGGIYVEASQAANWVDHNVIWNSTKTNGIYSFFISNLTVAHNLIGGCAGAGIMILDVGGRPEGNPGGGNRIVNNILVENAWQLTLRTQKNVCDHNLFQCLSQPEGFRLGFPETKYDLTQWQQHSGLDRQSLQAEVAIRFDLKSRELNWKPGMSLPKCPPLPGMEQDYWGRTRVGSSTVPGPFVDFDEPSRKLAVDPKP